MARRLDHQRFTTRSKVRFHLALFLGGLGMIPVSRLLLTSNAGATFGAPLSVAGPMLVIVALAGMLSTLVQRHTKVRCPHCGATHMVERGVLSFLCTSCGARVGAVPSGYEKKDK